MPDAPRRSLCELARHSGGRAAARLRAGAPTFGAQTLVAIPLTMTLSVPRERRMSSRSVPWNAPKRGFSRTLSPGSTFSSLCSAAGKQPLAIIPSRTEGMISPITPTLEPSTG